MVWRIVGSARRTLQNIRKSPRVADETMVTAAGAADDVRRRPGGLSAVYGLYRVLTSALACFSGPRMGGADGVWALSVEYGQASEMNHLIVSDSMRYAILL